MFFTLFVLNKLGLGVTSFLLKTCSQAFLSGRKIISNTYNNYYRNRFFYLFQNQNIIEYCKIKNWKRDKIKAHKIRAYICYWDLGFSQIKKIQYS